MTLKLLACLFLSAIPVLAQNAPKSLALTDKSNVPSKDISKALQQKKCHNVSITSDASKSDLKLEATKHKQDILNSSFDLALSDHDVITFRNTPTWNLDDAVKQLCQALARGANGGSGVPGALAQTKSPRVFIASNHAWSSTASVTTASHTEGSATATGSVDSQGNVNATQTTNSTTVGEASGHANGVEYSTTPKLAAALMQACPGVIITSDIHRADFVIEFGGSRVGEVAPMYGILWRNASVAVFLPNGDSVLAKSDHTLKGTMQDVCQAIGMKPTK